jgi:acyl-CoA thioesterase I
MADCKTAFLFKILAWLVVWLLAAACAGAASGATPAAAGAPAAAKGAPAILVMGDSLSAEYGLARGKGWVALMEQRLQDKHLDYSVVNASISGETTAGGAARFAKALAQAKPAVVIIELGGNDGLRGLDLAAMRANFETMITQAQKAGARVLLAGMRMPPNYGRDYTSRFSAVYPELARKYKTALVPFILEGLGDKPEMFQADGIHPLPEMHPKILDNIWPALEPLLKSPARRPG